MVENCEFSPQTPDWCRSLRGETVVYLGLGKANPMRDLNPGDAVLVRGIVTHEGVRIGDRLVPAAEADVVTDVPELDGEPAALLMFFYDEVERANFAAAYRGLPGVECRDL